MQQCVCVFGCHHEMGTPKRNIRSRVCVDFWHPGTTSSVGCLDLKFINFLFKFNYKKATIL